MVYPYSDELLYYDKTKHRYILTPKCVLLELNTNLEQRLNTRGAENAENYAKSILDQISLYVYNFIYQHNAQWLFVQKILAKCPSAREVIKEAMKQQVLYFLMNGQIDKYSGVDVRSGRAMDLRDLRGLSNIDPQTIIILEQPLVETNTSLLFRGRYNNILTSPPDYEKEGY